MLRGRCGFVASTHTYTIGPWVVPGISEILKVAGKVDERWIPQSARVRGQLIHVLTEHHDLKWQDIAEHVGPFRGWCLAYVDFKAQDKPVYRYIEQCFYHRNLGFATTIDRVGRRRGPMVLNIKTGPFVHAHEIQAAGELLAFDGKWTGRKRETLYIRKNRSFNVEEHHNDADRDEFIDCLQTWRKECHDPAVHGPLNLLSDLSRRSRLRFA